jgi:hypothetical protein
MKLLRNDAGSYPTKSKEQVVNIKKMAGRLVIFALDNVSVFSHKSSPVSTLSPDMQNISPGIINAGAVDGDNGNLIYLDENYRLWWINGKFQPVLLDYQEWFKPMAGKDVIISRNDLNGSYYISDGTITYILTWDFTKDSPIGLSSTPQVITSYASISGKMHNLGTDLNDRTWHFQTSPFDLERPGLKSLRWLMFYGEEGVLDLTEGTIYFRIWWRQSSHASFKESSWKKVNKDGASYFPVSGNQFMIELKGEDLNQVDLYQIQVNYQNEDGRYTRGINVSQANQ